MSTPTLLLHLPLPLILHSLLPLLLHLLLYVASPLLLVYRYTPTTASTPLLYHLPSIYFYHCIYFLRTFTATLLFLPCIYSYSCSYIYSCLHTSTLPIRRYHSRYPPPLSGFFWKRRGVSGAKFFIRDFLTKKFSGASRRRKKRGGISILEGGVSGVIPSDTPTSVFSLPPTHFAALTSTHAVMPLPLRLLLFYPQNPILTSV